MHNISTVFKSMSQKEQTTNRVNSSQESLKKVINTSFRVRVYRLLRKLLVGFILVSIANAMFSYFFYTPKSYRLHRENHDLIDKYQLLSAHIRTSQNKLSNVKHRDNNLYRSLFAIDTINIPGIYNSYPEGKYEYLSGDTYAKLMTSTWKELDALARSVYRESVSLDEVQILSNNKEQLSDAIPAIWPIDRTRLRNMDHYGMRLHPIYRRYVFHRGIDMSGDVGDPIYATGNAIVESTSVGLRRSGYGKQIILDHKFGYKTRYAHLNRVLVKRGDTVKRGQLIAELGKTGGTTGPHIHYEVILRDRPVNPINYFDRNMTHEEYIELTENIKSANLEIFE